MTTTTKINPCVPIEKKDFESIIDMSIQTPVGHSDVLEL